MEKAISVCSKPGKVASVNLGATLCDICLNQGVACTNCVHDNTHRHDYFEEMSTEGKEAKGKGGDHYIRFRLRGERIVITDSRLKENFFRVFDKVRDFLGDDYDDSMVYSVLCGESFLLVATDVMLGRFSVDVPEELIGKQIIDRDDDGVWLSSHLNRRFTSEKMSKYMDWSIPHEAPLAYTVPGDDVYIIFMPCSGPDNLDTVEIAGGPMIQRRYLNEASKHLAGYNEFTVRWWPGESCNPVLIETAGMECAIMPVRRYV